MTRERIVDMRSHCSRKKCERKISIFYGGVGAKDEMRKNRRGCLENRRGTGRLTRWKKIGDTIFSFFFFFFLSFYVSAGIMPRDEETAQTELKRRTRDGNFLWRKLIRREKSLSLSPSRARIFAVGNARNNKRALSTFQTMHKLATREGF